MKKKFKALLGSLVALTILLYVSCNSDDGVDLPGSNDQQTTSEEENEPDTLAVEDFQVSIQEGLPEGTSLGVVPVVTNLSSFTFELVDQSVDDAIGVDPNNGNLFIANPNAFNYEDRTQLTAQVLVRSVDLEANAQILIDLEDYIEQTQQLTSRARSNEWNNDFGGVTYQYSSSNTFSIEYDSGQHQGVYCCHKIFQGNTMNHPTDPERKLVVDLESWGTIQYGDQHYYVVHVAYDGMGRIETVEYVWYNTDSISFYFEYEGEDIQVYNEEEELVLTHRVNENGHMIYAFSDAIERTWLYEDGNLVKITVDNKSIDYTFDNRNNPHYQAGFGNLFYINHVLELAMEWTGYFFRDELINDWPEYSSKNNAIQAVKDPYLDGHREFNYYYEYNQDDYPVYRSPGMNAGINDHYTFTYE